MRIRFKPYARPELAAWPFYIDEPMALRGHWGPVFDDSEKPLRVEFGCGKGGFLARRALAEPQANYLGIDIKSEVLVVAKRNIERIYAEHGLPPANIRLTGWEIEQVERILAAKDRVERLYINFCNPWYKSGHAKHRLTHPRQLAKASAFMRAGAAVWFKTDDERLFSDSLRYFEMSGFAVTWMSRDLHKEEPVWNIRTEHEEHFAAQGVAIKACIAEMRPGPVNLEALSRLKNI